MRTILRDSMTSMEGYKMNKVALITGILGIQNMTAIENSNNCLEGCRFIAVDSIITVESI